MEKQEKIIKTVMGALRATLSPEKFRRLEVCKHSILDYGTACHLLISADLINSDKHDEFQAVLKYDKDNYRDDEIMTKTRDIARRFEQEKSKEKAVWDDVQYTSRNSDSLDNFVAITTSTAGAIEEESFSLPCSEDVDFN